MKNRVSWSRTAPAAAVVVVVFAHTQNENQGARWIGWRTGGRACTHALLLWLMAMLLEVED